MDTAALCVSVGFPRGCAGRYGHTKQHLSLFRYSLAARFNPYVANDAQGNNPRKTEQLLNTIRNKVPGIAIRTTLITGHPGETEADFDELLKFVEEQRFERLGVFTYSHEENTHAWTMIDDVPPSVKQQRADEVMALQERISYEINEQKVGQIMKVLVDRKEGGYYIGRTEFDSPEVDNEVLIECPDYLRIGDFTHVKITAATEFDLFATVV